MNKIIIIFSMGLFLACSQEKTIDERYIYERDKILDIETGDEYIMEESGQFTIVHDDGTTETVAIDETPFFGTTLSDQYIQDWKDGMDERQEKLLLEKKAQLKEVRKNRYADLSDEELMDKFQESHEGKINLTIQMDMVAELIERGVISTEEAPDILEIEPDLVNLDVDIDTLE